MRQPLEEKNVKPGLHFKMDGLDCEILRYGSIAETLVVRVNHVITSIFTREYILDRGRK